MSKNDRKTEWVKMKTERQNEWKWRQKDRKSKNEKKSYIDIANEDSFDT